MVFLYILSTFQSLCLTPENNQDIAQFQMYVNFTQIPISFHCFLLSAFKQRIHYCDRIICTQEDNLFC